jgi:pullulanase/glycogen debranching enzyme
MELYHEGHEERFYAIINAYTEALDFELPPLNRHLSWGLLIDTYNEPPDDIIPLIKIAPLNKQIYHSRPHSVTILRTVRK